MHSPLNRVLLLQRGDGLAFLGEDDPNFPWEKSHWDNKVQLAAEMTVDIKNQSPFAMNHLAIKSCTYEFSSESIIDFLQHWFCNTEDLGHNYITHFS